MQLGLVEDKPARVNKPTAGHYAKAGVPPTRVRREVTVAAGGDTLKAGDQVLVSVFKDGDRVDIVGTSKGHGFQGVIKRHNFAGGRATQQVHLEVAFLRVHVAERPHRVGFAAGIDGHRAVGVARD